MRELCPIISVPDIFRSENERKAFAVLLDKTDEIRDAYIKKHQNYISADSAKEFFVGYTGQNAYEFERPSGAIAEIIFDGFVQKHKHTDGTILWTAGGTGSGKTELAKQIKGTLKKNEIIFDSTCSNKKRVNRRIQKGLENDFKEIIMYTYRPVEQAFTDGVMERIKKREQRIIPIKNHTDSHINSTRLLLDLHEEFRDDSRVSFIIFDNSIIGQKPTVVDSYNIVKNSQFDRDVVQKELFIYLKQEYIKGVLTESQFEEFTKGLCYNY